MRQDSTPATPVQVNRDFGALPLFDPERGTTVVEPLGRGPGWWAGAPGACWTGERFYLSYRLRRPQPDRGGEARIAVSADGVAFETIWAARKEDFGSPSIERSALVRADDGAWRLYVSYVDGADGRWRIDLLEASSPDAFDPASRAPVLTAGAVGAEGVKDPWVCRLGGEWQMIVSYAPSPPPGAVDPAQLHATRDVYNTGLTRSLTGLATSADGRRWRWEGGILGPPNDGWDAYATRLNSAVWRPPVWVGYYDGSASVEENYEERCGIATGDDLTRWTTRSEAGPALESAHATRALRYASGLGFRGRTHFFFEAARADGAHELRLTIGTDR
jgi:hypothetical protein